MKFIRFICEFILCKLFIFNHGNKIITYINSKSSELWHVDSEEIDVDIVVDMCKYSFHVAVYIEVESDYEVPIEKMLNNYFKGVLSSGGLYITAYTLNY